VTSQTDEPECTDVDALATLPPARPSGEHHDGAVAAMSLEELRRQLAASREDIAMHKAAAAVADARIEREKQVAAAYKFEMATMRAKLAKASDDAGGHETWHETPRR
jgi:hypothetical protein